MLPAKERGSEVPFCAAGIASNCLGHLQRETKQVVDILMSCTLLQQPVVRVLACSHAGWDTKTLGR